MSRSGLSHIWAAEQPAQAAQAVYGTMRHGAIHSGLFGPLLTVHVDGLDQHSCMPPSLSVVPQGVFAYGITDGMNSGSGEAAR